MRPLRILKQGVWYEIRTRVNNREPLFRRETALAIFARVFRETKLRFVFEIRALRLEDDWLMFYIKPADGLELPAIMKRLKQVFAQRYNRREGRIGHIWGDRYWSRIAAEEERGASTGDIGIMKIRMRVMRVRIMKIRMRVMMRVRPRYGERTGQAVFLLIFPLSTTPEPG
ncbi:MAG: transposase [Spirochaetaceae bacterium]|nr:transposase [Spirochaetaceae bacterium]